MSNLPGSKGKHTLDAHEHTASQVNRNTPGPGRPDDLRHPNTRLYEQSASVVKEQMPLSIHRKIRTVSSRSNVAQPRALCSIHSDARNTRPGNIHRAVPRYRHAPGLRQYSEHTKPVQLLSPK